MVLGRLSRQLRPTEAGAAAGLTPTKVAILFAVVREGRVRMSDLAAREGVNPTMLSRAISNLAEKQLIERLSDPSDGRAFWAQPTDAGRALVDTMRRERTDSVRLALEALPPDEQTLLARALPALEGLSEQLKARA